MHARPMMWHVEPRQTGKTLVLTYDGVRYLCPLINSLEWSIKALKSMVPL